MQFSVLHRLLGVSVCVGVFGVGILPTQAFAVTSRSSDANVGVSNDFGQGNDAFIILDGDFDSNGAPVSASVQNRAFTGLNSEYNSQTMFYSGSASAYSNFGRLGASASGSVTNNFYNSDNVKYYDYDISEINPDGVPNNFIVNGQASFTDTLQYGGTAIAYTSRYILNLTGSVSGGEAFVYIAISHGSSGQSESFFYSATGNYNIPINSTAFVGGPNQTFSIRMLTSFQADASYYSDGSNFSGSAAFGNTLELVGVDVRDENGILLSATQITGESGTTYAITAVPEPTSLALLGLGGLCVLRRRR